MTIRWAAPHEGQLIKSFCHEAQYIVAENIDWSRPLGLCWLVADSPTPVGCLMVNFGAPVGRAEFLSVSSRLSFRTKAKVVRALCFSAIENLAKHGSQLVMFDLDHRALDWQGIVEKRGAVCCNTVNSYLKKV